MALTEADTCRKYVVPMLQEAGWDERPYSINEQRSFTDGRITFIGGKARRGKQKRADYLLKYRADFTIAVVEAKSKYKSPSEGLQQAKDYAEMLGLKFAYSTNGKEIIEFDFITGIQARLSQYPSPEELWQRLSAVEGLVNEDLIAKLLSPTLQDKAKPLRYYQELAINKTVQAILQGKKRNLLTLCTGAGKTSVAFQISWKLWTSRWNNKGTQWRPKILFLADRNVLVDDPMAKDFSPFGEAREKITGGNAIKSRDIYFATYQSIAKDENRPGLYKQYAPNFFDLIIIDECHRGSSRDDGNWREILEWFEPAYQLGMTATPRREDNVDTYNYFGQPIYEYSLAQGIADGFLAPYRVHRIITDYDAAGWRPTKGQVDRYGREVPDVQYGTKDFERVVAMRARTKAFARHLTKFLRETDPFSKTIVFCVNQEHALEMRDAIAELNKDFVKQYPDYVCRVTADEGDVGSAHRAKFQDIETKTPAILTSSQMLTTGVDAPTCKNVVLARVVGSMPEFKQIIGRGTRLRPDYGKLAFNIIDYTGTATEKFSDPEFDGDPVQSNQVTIDEEGEVVEDVELTTVDQQTTQSSDDTVSEPTGSHPDVDQEPGVPRKYYVDGGVVELIRHLVYELDGDGKKLSCRQLTDYTGDKVRTLYPNASELRHDWLDLDRRLDIVKHLEEKGIDLDSLGETVGKPESDPFDLICHLAYNAPLRTRRERAERLRREESDFFDKYGPEAVQILDALIDKYSEYGLAQFKVPEILEVPPFNGWGNLIEIASRFGGGTQLRGAVGELQRLLYTA